MNLMDKPGSLRPWRNRQPEQGPTPRSLRRTHHTYDNDGIIKKRF